LLFTKKVAKHLFYSYLSIKLGLACNHLEGVLTHEKYLVEQKLLALCVATTTPSGKSTIHNISPYQPELWYPSPCIPDEARIIGGHEMGASGMPVRHDVACLTAHWPALCDLGSYYGR
jgi:hypothetical protein